MALEYKARGNRELGHPKRRWTDQQHLQNWVSTGHDPVFLHLYKSMLMTTIIVNFNWQAVTSSLLVAEVFKVLSYLLFLDDTHRRLVAIYRRFGTTYRSHIQGSSSPTILPEPLVTQLYREWCGRWLITAHTILYISAYVKYARHSSWTAWPLRMGPIGCTETSVNNYKSTLPNIPEELRSHLHRDRSLKSLKVTFCVSLHWILRRIQCKSEIHKTTVTKTETQAFIIWS
jgi:hypothetical protein